MYHLANFIHLFSVSIGLISIYIAIVLHKRTRYRALRSYIHFLIGINVVIFLMHFLEALLRAIVGDDMYEANLPVYYVFLILLFSLCRLYMSLAFLRFCYQLLQRNFSRRLYYAAVLILLMVILILFVLKFDDRTIAWVETLTILVVHLALAAAMTHGSLMILRQGEKAELLVPGMIRPTFWFFIVYAITGVILRIANLWSEDIPEFILMLGVGFLALVFNGLNAIYLSKIFQMPRPLIRFSDSQLIKKYGITPREREIIRFICQGKTNKEIAEALFISPITVRDHISNIFRKTGVKSRTQLAGLFIQRPAG